MTLARLLSTASNAAEGLPRVHSAVVGSVSSYGCGRLLTDVLSSTGRAIRDDGIVRPSREPRGFIHVHCFPHTL